MSHIERIAKRKLSAPDGWEVCGWERVGADGLIVQGGVPRLLKSGKNKGRRTFRDSAISRVVLTDAEIKEEKARFSQETGKCAECEGSGQEWAGWSAAEGNRYRTCRACDGSGIKSAQS